MEIDFKDSSKNVLNMEKESKSLQMEIHIKDLIKTENHRDMENICGMMEALIKEISIMGFEMAKESGKMDN